MSLHQYSTLNNIKRAIVINDMTLSPAIYRFTFSFLFSIHILLMGNDDLLFKRKLVSYTSAFNLDVSLPFTKKGPAGSYFGFSVAQHLMWNQETSNHIPVWVSYLLIFQIAKYPRRNYLLNPFEMLKLCENKKGGGETLCALMPQSLTRESISWS